MPFKPLSTSSSGFRPSGRSGGAVFTGARGIQSPTGKAAVRAAETAAGESAKESFERGQEQEFLKQLTSLGKPLSEVEFSDVYKASGGNVRAAKKFIELRNAFMGEKSTQKQAAEAAVGTIEELARLAQSIPSASGFFGRNIRGPLNALEERVGSIPEKTVFDNIVSFVLPMVRKAAGDTGNVGEREQANIKPAIEQLAHPQKEVRAEGMRTLENIFKKAFGKTVNLSPAALKSKANSDGDGLKELSNEELMELL